MYVYYNANPARKSHGDCVIRALSKVMDLTWEQVAIDLSMMQVTFHEMQNNDHVWGTYLSLNGFEKGFQKAKKAINKNSTNDYYLEFTEKLFHERVV